MWGSVLLLALLATLDPVRLGITVLVISRPRPIQNLFVYWLGSVIVGIPYMLVPLMVLHAIPTFTSFLQDLAKPNTVAGAAVRHVQIGLGVLCLSIALLMTVRLLARQRERVPPSGGGPPVVADPETPTLISRLLGRSQDAPSEGSTFRRLLERAHNAWENGSLWVSFVIGTLSPPPGDGVLLVVTIIVASGVAIGAQISAAIAFVFGMLAIIEIALISYLVTPAKTLAVVQRLHDWVRARRQQILLTMFTVGGIFLIAHGLSRA